MPVHVPHSALGLKAAARTDRKQEQAMSGAATAVAQPNIALVKYWGKRETQLNLPAADSLSVTLDALFTRTRVVFDPDAASDALYFAGEAATAPQLARVSTFVDLFRQQAGTRCRVRVETTNNFPTAAGLASSASGFAALATASNAALGLSLDRAALSALARRGSGSAARSLFGGFVVMHAGTNADGTDAFAEPLAPVSHWPLEVVIAVTSAGAKVVGSGHGMEATRETSPYHAAWIDSVPADMAAARAAIESRDMAKLGEVAEHSALKMHADMLATRPPLIYWTPASVAVIQRVRELREKEQLEAFFTMDAGPQVKVVCQPHDAARVAEELREVPGVHSVLRTTLGQGACVDTTAEVA